jgi:DNA transformation protein
MVMSKGTNEFAGFVADQLASLKGVVSRRFFGGVGMAVGGTQFAMIMGNTLYFVVDAQTRLKYEAMGATCFSYSTKNGRVQVKKYFSVPSEVLEDPQRLIPLAKEAVQVATKLKKPRQ